MLKVFQFIKGAMYTTLKAPEFKWDASWSNVDVQPEMVIREFTCYPIGWLK